MRTEYKIIEFLREEMELNIDVKFIQGTYVNIDVIYGKLELQKIGPDEWVIIANDSEIERYDFEPFDYEGEEYEKLLRDLIIVLTLSIKLLGNG